MEEAPEKGKELSNSAHANGMNEWSTQLCCSASNTLDVLSLLKYETT